MRICPNCFKDEYLKNYIKSNGIIGSCDFCGTHEIYAIDVIKLATLFLPLINVFECIDESPLDENNKSLGYCLQGYFELFSSSDRMVHNRILDEMRRVNEQESTFILFDDPFGEWDTNWIDTIVSYNIHRWFLLVNYLHYIRRYLYDKSQEVQQIADSFINAFPLADKVLKEGTTVYRARLGHDETEKNGFKVRIPYPLNKMGAPPPDLASSGRANPAGIPYLYLASTEKTALSEVRPWKAAYVCVARFRIIKDLKVLDLNDISLFKFSNLKDEFEKIYLLSCLNRELSTPIDPSKSHIEYVPTQFLTELIISQGYDGIIFKSAMGEGNNIVLFDQVYAIPEDVSIYRVTDVHYSYEPGEYRIGANFG